MIWNCPVCNEELGELNPWCEFCYWKDDKHVKIYNPDKYYVRDIRIYWLSRKAQPMTPQEELFQKFFNGEVKIALAKTPLERKALREEASEIILHAKITISAIDHVDEEEKKSKRKANGPTGFTRNLNTDETTTNAINIVRERQKRLTKKEIIEKQLKELYALAGNPDAATDAAIAASNRNILEVTSRTERSKQAIVDEAISQILTGESAKMIVSESIQPSGPGNSNSNSNININKIKANPFAKKDKQ